MLRIDQSEIDDWPRILAFNASQHDLRDHEFNSLLAQCVEGEAPLI